MGEKCYFISEASKLVGVEAHVLRYWEEQLGLAIRRNEMGHRYYIEEDIRLMQSIRLIMEKGIQLRAVKMMLPSLMQHREDTLLELMEGNTGLYNQVGSEDCPGMVTGDGEKGEIQKVQRIQEDQDSVSGRESLAAEGGRAPQGIPAAEDGRAPQGIPAAEGGRAPQGIPAAEGGRAPQGIPAAEDGRSPQGIPAAEGGRSLQGIPAAEGGRSLQGIPAAEDGQAPEADVTEGQWMEGGISMENGQMTSGGQWAGNRPTAGNVPVIGQSGAFMQTDMAAQAEAARELRMAQFQEIMINLIDEALQRNNPELADMMSEDVSERVIKEMDYLMRLREEQEEDRYKRLDETIRSLQKVRGEVAATKTKEKRRFRKRNKELI